MRHRQRLHQQEPAAAAEDGALGSGAARPAGSAHCGLQQRAAHRELSAELKHLADQAAEQARREGGGPATVDILGRYNFDRQLVPAGKVDGLKVGFRTAHSSKGLEADYVILPNVTSGTYGFPSTIQDDPVLALAMAEADDYPHAEERRLFYVALTRARRQVTLLSV